ncbi:hypothetical protein WG936_07645 [Corynebacterium sp. H127]|uniref:hypothetical protein n=1 Tax=Corynebacterium sp. H127 TaxID=3133418 RepID=UPI0030A14944
MVEQIVVQVDETGKIASLDAPTFGGGISRAGERAPDCIRAQSEWGFVQVYNDCPFDLRVKVIFAFAADSVCKLVLAGTRTNISPSIGRIDGIETC